MSGRPNYGQYNNPGARQPNGAQPNWNTSASYSPGSMGSVPGNMLWSAPYQTNMGMTGTLSNPANSALQGAGNPYAAAGTNPMNGSAPPGVGGTMTNLGQPGMGMSVRPGIGNAVGQPGMSTPDPSFGQRPPVTGDPNGMIGGPYGNAAVNPAQRGGVPFMNGRGVVATGPIGSNGQPTVTFDDVDRYQRGMLGLQ